MLKKICILTSAHKIFDNRIFHKEAKSFIKEGYDVTIIAQHDKNETVDGIRIVALQKAKNRFHRFFVLVLKVFILALKQKSDIYHLHDPELLFIGALLKIFTGGKVIYDVHEDYKKAILSKPYIPRLLRKIIACLVAAIEHLLSTLLDGIITATDDILKNFASCKRAIAVRNVPIMSKFPIVKEDRHNVRDVFNLIYVGTMLDKEVGITSIVEALELIDSSVQVRLTLCGNFYQINYENEIRKLKGFEKVDYLGLVDLHRIPGLLQKSDAGLVCFLPEPNHINAMPNKLFEFMAAYLPVIASNFPLWRSIIKDNNCGLCIDPLDPKAIASAIQYLVDHTDEAKTMGNNGRKLVDKKYNWENEERKLFAIYKEICF